MTRAVLYPKADHTSQWFGGTTMPKTKLAVAWHTTEMGVPGEPWPSYVYNGNPGGSAPHFTCKPDRANRRLLWRQHYRLDAPSKALRHPEGTPQTNNTGIVQVELGGTSVKGDPGYYWPDADEWALRELAYFSLWLEQQWGIPLTDQGRRWPHLVRNANGFIVQVEGSARLTWAAWDASKGHHGHTHVPGNDHVDGPRCIPTMLAIASAIKSGDDVDAATIKAIARAVLAEPVTLAWNGQDVSLEWAISQLHYYGLSGGFVGSVPKTAGTAPGSPTTAALNRSQLDELEALVRDVRALVTPPEPAPQP